MLHPCAKINLGLNIVSRRPDGYHNLETVFYPIPLYDTLEVVAEPLFDAPVTSIAIEIRRVESCVRNSPSLMSLKNWQTPQVFFLVDER